MPNSASAKKRLRQNDVLKGRNKAIKTAVRTQIKKVRAAVEEGDMEKAETEFRTASKKLDKAGAKGIIHKNKSARHKSRLRTLIRKAQAS